MRDINPEAYFDALAIMGDAPRSLIPMSIVEMHLFSYLSCILALFRGLPIGDWGYSYAVTAEGFPFSAEFEDARQATVVRGLTTSMDSGLLQPLQPETSDELDIVLRIGSWGQRRVWIGAALQCALALPMGSIRHAIAQTPGMAASLRLRQKRHLLDVDDVSLIYEEYKIVDAALGGAEDLLSPAVIWLSARILRRDGDEIAA